MTSQAGFLNLKRVNIMWTFHVNNSLYMFNFFGMVYTMIMANIAGFCVLPVTSRPGLGRVSSTQDLGKNHIQKSM